MQILWVTFAAIYMSVLAFVAGQITAHVVVARQPGNFAPSNESLLVALLQFAGLVIVGLILGTRRMRTGARAANMPRPEHSHQRRAGVLASAIEIAETSAVAPAVRAVDESAEIEVFEPASASRVAEVLERVAASEVGEAHDTWEDPRVLAALESHAASEIDTSVEQTAQQNAGEVREGSADRGVADVADRRAEGTGPVSVSPAIVQRVVEPPSKPAPAPRLAAPRIITGKSREAVARAWVGGGALIVAGVVGFALGGRVQLGRPIAALLAVLGLGLVARAVAVAVQRRRVGKTWVQLRNSPIAPGSELDGFVWSSNRRLRRAVRYRQPMRPARVRLLCLHGPAPTVRGRSMTNSALVWQKEVAVRSDRMTVSTGHLGVPFRFDVPADVPEVSRPGDANPIVWLLSVEMAIDGIALAEQFELPIYQLERIVPRSAA